MRPGLYTTVQDLGRWGFQSQGVPVAGPMDLFSHRLANALVGNARTAAALEVTLVGPELEFDDERLVVVTGAEFALAVDAAAVPCGRPFVVPAESRLGSAPVCVARAPIWPSRAASTCLSFSGADRPTCLVGSAAGMDVRSFAATAFRSGRRIRGALSSRGVAPRVCRRQ